MEQVLPMTQEFISRECPTIEPDQLIAACQQGDREAFRLLFELHKDKVYSIALHYSGNEAIASDISQQVFLKLFTRINKFHYQSEFSTWLYRIVANSCLDERRRWRRFIHLEEAEVATSLVMSPDAMTNYSRREVSQSVRLAIFSLKPKLRIPILLKYLEGMSYEEISQILGCSIGTVSSRIHRAHKLLALKLKQYQSVSAEFENAE